MFLLQSKDPPEIFQVAPDNELGDPNTEILIQGRALNRKCQPMARSIVDIWYAGGNPGNCIFLSIRTNRK